MEWVRERFGVDLCHISIVRSGKRRLRAISKDLEGVGVSKEVIRGIYLAKKAPFGYIVSIEGSYLIGPRARRNVVELSREDFKRWMRGEDLKLNLKGRGIYIVKHGEIYAGSGFYDGRILKNLIPRERTLED